MTNQQAPEALRPIARYKIGYATDDWGMRDSTPSGIPDPAGAWVRYEDHIAAMAGAQQPAPSAAVASKAVLAAIRAANMQLVRTGDDEFMLVTYKNAKAQCDGGKCGIGGYCDDCPTPQADSQPAPVEELDDDACRREPSDYVRPADYDGDGSVAAMARRAAKAASQPAGVTLNDAIEIAKSLGVHEYGPNTRNWSFEYSQLAQFVALLTAAAYVDADRAARAPADSVAAPAGGAMDGWKLAPEEPTLHMGWAYLDAANESDPLRTHTFNHAGYRAMLAVAPTPPAQAADSVLEDAERLDFLCSTDKVRMIECEQKGLWRVYQDEAPPEAAQHHWQAIASEWHTTPRAAIDAARKQGGAT